MNKTILIGFMTRKPELKQLENISLCSFTIAISRDFKNKNGEYDTDFINVKVFGKQAENVVKYCGTGSLIAVDGRIQTGSYDNKDGKKAYFVEVIADKVKFLSNKQNTTTTEEPKEETAIETKKLADDVFSDFGEQIEFDDEVGF